VPRLVSALALRFPSIQAHPDLPDRVTVALDEIGVAAVHELGSDDEPTWHVFLANQADLLAAQQRLQAQFASQGCRAEVVEIADEDWAARTQAHLTHVTVGRLVVAPPWDVPHRIPPDVHVIVIPPSMGFGTGHHETTRLCLRLLQQWPLDGKRVLDVGTGSGVLAIAARLLGAGDVEAIDYDEDAIVAARESLSINGMAGQVSVRTADLRADSLRPADVLIANLTGALLVDQAARLVDLTAEGGALILSGFQTSEGPDVLAAFAPLVSAVDQDRLREGEWEAVRLLRTPTSR
jgi:ribosomal protein L11 methyltransferase